MKKVVIMSLIFIIAITAVSFADSSAANYSSGKLMLGLNGDFPDDDDVIIGFEAGFFPADNFMVDLEANVRNLDEDFRIRLDSGIKYFISGFLLVPYLGTEFSYVILDEIGFSEDIMSIVLVTGVDLFVIQGISLYFEAYPTGYWYLDGDGDVIDFSYNFGLHLFL